MDYEQQTPQPQQPEKKTPNPLATLLKVVLGLVVISLVLVILAFSFVSRQVDNALHPLQQVNAGLSTQVSRLLNPPPRSFPTLSASSGRFRPWLALRPSNIRSKRSSPPN
jgi:predicted PurR-regulated permease PerM